MKKLSFIYIPIFLCLLFTRAYAADPDLEWRFKSLGEDANGNTSTILYLDVNKNPYEIATELGGFYEINSADFKDYGIPKSALIACQCWWAGAGADYWVVKKESTLVIMKRDISEGDPEHPSDYTSKPVKVKTIRID